MKLRLIFCIKYLFLFFLPCRAQISAGRPALVVGIVVDQMRQDFLYRYSGGFGLGGFRRMQDEGFSFTSCRYSYVPTYTAPGHASIFTGTTPAVHGIVGNNWLEKNGEEKYCTRDARVQGIGGKGKQGKMSPTNMLAGSVADQVRLASGFRGKSFGISLKDRGAILPAGHAANAAFWYDFENGNFISSDWYRDLNGRLPAWLEKFNASGPAQAMKDSVWKPLLPSHFYCNSKDNQPWENALEKGKDPVFPYPMSGPGCFSKIASSPFGNRLTAEAAMALVEGEGLGMDSICDFLSVSFSSTDIVGHSYGPSAIETEDCYFRLDRDLDRFFSFLDKKVGKGRWLCFLTADHGVMEVPAFLESRQMPSGLFSEASCLDSLRRISLRVTGKDWISGLENLQVSLREGFFSLPASEQESISLVICRWLENQPAVLRAFPLYGQKPWPEPPFLDKVLAGYFPGRSGQIQVLLKAPWLNQASAKGTTHGSPYAYDSHVPCLWLGWKIAAGEDPRPVAVEDIAVSLSSLIRIGFPTAATGRVQPIPLRKTP